MTTAIPGSRPCERVLAINDDPDTLETLRDLLELHGSKVEIATRGDQALAIMAAGFQPSAILLDNRLGAGERGDRFAERLRADPNYAKIPIVLMSGDIRALRERGSSVDATLSKPFDLDHLYETLDGLCAHRDGG